MFGQPGFFYLSSRKFIRNGKTRSDLNVFGWIHFSSLRIMVTLVFSGLHEQDNNEIYVKLGKQL